MDWMMLKCCHPISLFALAVIIFTTVGFSLSTSTRIITATDAFIFSPSSSVVVGVRNIFCRRGGSSCSSSTVASSTISSLAATTRSTTSSSSNDINQKKCRHAKVIIVLGGSGFIGRRVCRDLVYSSSMSSDSNNHDGEEVITTSTTKVISVSRSGKPASYYLNDNDNDNDNDTTDDNDNWYNQVEWIQHDILALKNDETNDNVTVVEEGQPKNNTPSLSDKIQAALLLSSQQPSSVADKDSTDNIIADIDLTIVGCIGNLNPSLEWIGFFGLGFNNENLFHSNGLIYEQFINTTLLPLLLLPLQQKQHHQRININININLQRFVLLSIDYISQKCLEGPIEGYVDGKRFTEHKFVETLREITTQHDDDNSEIDESSDSDSDSGSDSNDILDNVIVIGLSSFVYGGKRFPLFGKLYRSFVKSLPVKAYVKSNQVLRSLSSYSKEDWVEELLFSSSPIDVNVVAKITTLASHGLVTRDMVNGGSGQPRKQGFFNSKGKPVLYDDILFVDGTKEIENIVLNNNNKFDNDVDEKLSSSPSSSRITPSQALWEGALIGKRPFLYPIPVVVALLLFFWSVVTEQFITY
jgi:hypothetical protein